LRWEAHAEDPEAMADDEVVALARLLCRYWRDNPRACAPIEGIARWWLPADRAASVVELQTALRRLESRHLVGKVVGRDGRVHYRLQPHVAGHLGLLDAELDAPSEGNP
jgi:hypothetical protein